MEFIKSRELNTLRITEKSKYRYLNTALSVLIVLLAIMPHCLRAQATRQSHSAMLTQHIKTRKYRANVLNKIISVDLYRTTLEQGLQAIAKKTGLKLVYSENVIPAKKRVSLQVKNIKLEDALWKLLADTDLRFAVSSHNHLVLMKSAKGKKIFAESKQIQAVSGTVTDAKSGKTLPGVNILVKGTTTGTSTDIKGYYQLNVSSLQDTLIFSYIGYKDRRIALNGRSTVNISMQPQVLLGQEMVVVGYGTQKKEDVTGAISSVSSDQLKDQPVTNLQGALEGKSAGVQITQNSGEPGSIAKVRIRGLTSINNSDPLYVVDGVPLASNSINSIETNNIASIQVLKDASAEAIYGSRGANGVVLIKTKQGSNNSQITANVYGGVQQVSKKMDLLHSTNFVKLNNEGFQNAGLDPSYQKNPSAYTTDTRWQDLLFRSAPIQNYNIAFSGGSQDLTYRASGGYLQQDGVITGSDYDRLSLRLNSTFDPRKNVEFGEHLSFTKSKQHGVLQQTTYDNVVIAAIQMDPTVPVKDENGNYSAPRYSDTRNPLARTNILTPANPTSIWGVVGNTYVQYDPIKGLTLKSNLSVDLNFNDNPNFTPQYNFAPNFTNPNPTLSHTKSQAFNWTWDNTATFETDLNADNHIKILGGISEEKYTFDFVNASNQGQPGNDPFLRYLNAGINNPQVGGQESQWALLSFIGRLNYNFKQTYFLTATLRRDGSSKFGTNNKYGNFPSASVGWVLTNEPFLPTGKVLSYLKLRGSWGIVGNQSSVGYYDYSSTIYNYYYPFGSPGTAIATAEPGGLANPDLHWEQVNQWNVGMDYRLFGDKVTGSVDYYNKTTKDMLLSLPILSESGFTTGPRSNVGSMLNSGLEFTADYQQTLNKNLNLDIGFHFSTLHNKVLDLQQQGEKIYSGGNKAGSAELTEVGHRVASFYGYVFDGIFQNQQQIDNHATQSGAQPGDIIFKDVNGDGAINDQDRTYLGTPIPKVTYGFNIGANYKDFDLNMSLSGVYGNKIFQAYKFYTDGFYLNNYNMTKEVLNRWHGEGTSNTIPHLTANDTNHNSRVSSFYLSDGSYLRLQNITLGYTLPQKLLQRVNIQNARIYLSGQNLLTFTKYDGYDPEIGTEFGGNGGTLDFGVDPGTYPQARTVSLGINLSL